MLRMRVRFPPTPPDSEQAYEDQGDHDGNTEERLVELLGVHTQDRSAVDLGRGCVTELNHFGFWIQSRARLLNSVSWAAKALRSPFAGLA